ncbi:hypothetical protein [Rheinheimera sp.]|uniref:hypothetical protein n=1 Tax=Rheinheimera sp. TaxID=1869214 RepID=UPI0027B9AE92|nr:hypothetical protein [Rheinheimera sp.]
MMNTLTDCSNQARQLALQFRLGKNTQAALDMATMVNTLIVIFPSSQPQHIKLLQQILGQCLDCQQRQDWLALADYLEYELQELLQLCS